MYKNCSEYICHQQVVQTDDVSTLDKEECASFLSECGLGVILTVSQNLNYSSLNTTSL